MPIVVTSAKGQVLIPVAFRKKIGLKPGAKVLITMAMDNRVLIEPVSNDPITALRGILKGGPSLTKALLVERRKDRDREEKKAARLLRRHVLAPRRAGRSAGLGTSRRDEGDT
jgi:AbrB family looped-hinge helix DNA binding protein